MTHEDHIARAIDLQGFTCVRSGWYERGAIRVVLTSEGTEVHAFTDARRLVCEWSTRFGASVPHALVCAFIEGAKS